jgi:hypothetical protein
VAYQRIDPVTGDKMSRGESATWAIQGVIRNWWFVLVFTALTIVVWSVGWVAPDVLVWWNLMASYLAILIESIVGRAMFGQARRDAVILRHIERVAVDLDDGAKPCACGRPAPVK